MGTTTKGALLGWERRREKYGPSGFSIGTFDERSEQVRKGWVTRKKNLRKSRRTRTPLGSKIMSIRYPCPECDSQRLIACLRHDLNNLYYHCSKCGNNIKDRAKVAEIYELKGL